MSELIKTNTNAAFCRTHLLTTVCGIALLVSASAKVQAQDEVDRPTVWIELGGQLERMSNGQETFDPSFLSKFDHLDFGSVLPLQRALRYSNGAEGRISFEPHGSDWVLSASLRYGRSNGHKGEYQRLPLITFSVMGVSPRQLQPDRQDVPYHINAGTTNAERHVIVDFEAGKDVGLGLFGKKSSSLVSAGVRFAQLSYASSTTLGGVPDFSHHGTDIKYGGTYQSHHRYAGSVDAERSFHGIGPSLSWDASAPVLGNGENALVSLDWGLNAAVLFGRQKVQGQQDTAGYHYSRYQYINLLKGKSISLNGLKSSYNHPVDLTRSRAVTVPNLGGFAGVSFRYADAKLSFGYRADVFFGAMDGGLTERKTYDRNFYGPYATISIGSVSYTHLDNAIRALSDTLYGTAGRGKS